MNDLKRFFLFLSIYWFLGSLLFLFVFGRQFSFDTLMGNPLTSSFNGTHIYLSSLLATIILFLIYKNKLAKQPYPYFMFGFYIGNLSLVILFVIDAILHNNLLWQWPYFLQILYVPFLQLIVAYIFAFPFLSLLPAWGAAYCLYKWQTHGS
ncbi:hypothetical protein E3983_03610 [Legionella israelensis]|uniref:Uncharacterized protein n=1 Tax=Legionella israelensis TaxID=454 RepID=A0AAX1EEJ3_9GAMM|nr:hypothetical protein [Legionella israelensis]QBR83523.1 hypothetical protein E3983_03610 [Legionella israelensis]